MVAKWLARRCSVAMACVAGALAATSCSTSPPAPPGATVPNSVLGQPPPTRPSPYAVPQVITKPYVQSVLNALEVVQAKATVSIASNRSFTPAAAALIHSVTTTYEYNFDHEAWQMDLKSGLQNLPAHPGAIVDTVQRVFPSTSTCIFASLTRRFDAVTTRPPRARTYYVVLKTKPTGMSNPTPWLIDQLGFNSQGLIPGDACSP